MPAPLRKRYASSHCPVNVAGIPWANVEALRRKGVDARLVVFNRGEAAPRGRLVARAPRRRCRGGSRRSPPRSHACCRRPTSSTSTSGSRSCRSRSSSRSCAPRGKKSVFHYLGSDIRGKSPAELAYGKRADAQIVGSYDAIRWVPEAHVVPPGLDLREYTPRPPSDAPRPLVVHAPSNRAKKGTRHVIEACAQLPVELDDRRRRPARRGARALRPRRHRRRPAERRLARRLRARGDGARQAGRRAPEAGRRRAQRRGRSASACRSCRRRRRRSSTRSARSSRTPRSAASSAPRSRAYVEQVHDIDRVADRLLDIYAGLVVALVARAQAARDAVGDLRPRRRHLPADRRLPAPGLHRLPRPRRLREDRDDRRAHERARDRAAARDHERVLPLLLRLRRRRAPDARRPHRRSGSRWGWRRSGLAVGFAVAAPARALAPPRRPVARARRVRRALGADELRADDRALPRRGAARAVRDREHRERADHDRLDDRARRRRAQGRDRRRDRQLPRHAHRLPRAARLPPLPARPPVRPLAAARDEPLRPAARSRRARALGDQPDRPPLHQRLQGPGRGRHLLARGADLVGDHLR